MPNNVGEWQYPTNTNTRGVDVAPAVVGIPSRLLDNFRNIGIEIVFHNLTSVDVGTVVHFRVGHAEAAVSVGDPVEITQDVVDSTEHTFFRQFVNMDVKKMSVDFSQHTVGTAATFTLRVLAGGPRE